MNKSKVENSTKVHTIPSVKGFRGQQLVFKQEEERDVYFRQLQEAWYA